MTFQKVASFATFDGIRNHYTGSATSGYAGSKFIPIGTMTTLATSFGLIPPPGSSEGFQRGATFAPSNCIDYGLPVLPGFCSIFAVPPCAVNVTLPGTATQSNFSLEAATIQALCPLR